MRFLIVAGVAFGCRGSKTEPTAEPPEQPIVKNGVRDTWAIDVGALTPDARPAALQLAVRTIRLRLAHANIPAHVALDKDMIVVDIAGKDLEVVSRAGDLIARPGRVELLVAEPESTFMTELAAYVGPDSTAEAERIAIKTEGWAAPDGKRVTDTFLESEDREQQVTVEKAKELGCLRGPGRDGETVRCRVTGCGAIQSYVAALGARDQRFVLPNHHTLMCERHRRLDAARPVTWRSYYVIREPLVPARIRAAAVGHTPDGRPAIELQLADPDALAAATKHHIGKRLVIALDTRVAAAPIIDGAIERPALVVEEARTPEQTADAARDLAIVLGSGALPGHVTLETRAQLVDGVPQAPPNE
jgi:hypothetical protein